MCYSANMSFSLAAVGALCTAAAVIDAGLRQQLVWIPFAFYTCMELLQGVQYSHVNRCGEKANVISTEIAYLLVIVQPLMWNVIYYRRTSGCERKVFVVGMAMAAVWIVMNVAARVLHGAPGFVERTNDTFSYVREGGTVGGEKGCTMKAEGNHHLYWKWSSADFRGMDANWLLYLLIWFVPALVSAGQRKNVLFAMGAAAIAFVITAKFGADVAEFASLWCMFSVPFLVLILAETFLFSGRGLRRRA